MKFQKGFTLIELLVVVAIISLLSSVVLASLGEAREKARVSKFKQELNQFVNAVELYRSDHGGDLPGYIPDFDLIELSVPSVGGVGSITYYNDFGESREFHDELIPYIPSLPVPISGYWYYYIFPDYIRCAGENEPYDYIILVDSSNPGFDEWPGFQNGDGFGGWSAEDTSYRCRSF